MPSSLRERLDTDREFDIFLGGGSFGSGAKKAFSNTADLSGVKICKNIDFCQLGGEPERSQVSPVDNNPFLLPSGETSKRDKNQTGLEKENNANSINLGRCDPPEKKGTCKAKCLALDFSEDNLSGNSDSLTRLTKIHEDSGEEYLESDRHKVSPKKDGTKIQRISNESFDGLSKQSK